MTRRFAPLLLAAALVACPGGAPGPKRSPSVERPVRGGILSVAIGEDVDFLDPQRAGQPAALAIMRALHRGLMAFPAAEYPRGIDPVPDLAEAPPDVSADGLLHTFRLRAGVRFGPPASRVVTAADARAGILRLLSSDSPYIPYFRVIAGVAAPDERTVVVRLARPVNDLLWILALPAASAVPSELVSVRRPAPETISPSGPYRLAPSDGYRPEASMHLIRNMSWRAESDPVRPAYADEIRIRIGGTAESIRDAITSDVADLSLDTPPPDPAALSTDPKLQPRLRTTPSGCLRYLWMNTSVSPFNDVLVRRAVADAITRDGILRAAGGALAGEATDSSLVRMLAGAPAQPAITSPNPNEAARVFRSLRLPRGFTSTLVVGDRPVDLGQARAVVAALTLARSFPIRISAAPIASVYVDHYEIPARRVPMGIATWCADWPGRAGRSVLGALLDSRTITSSGNQNYALLRDATLNRLLDAASLASPDLIEQAWRAAATRVTALAPWVPLLDLNEVSLVSSRVGRFVASPMHPRGDLTAVSLRPGARLPAAPS